MNQTTQNELTVGQLVVANNQRYRIESVISLTHVIATDSKGEEKLLRRSTVVPASETADEDTPTPEKPNVELARVSEEAWRTARSRREAILPILGEGRAAVEKRAEETGFGAATLYRWRSRYDGNLTSLLPVQRGPVPGSSQLDPIIEDIVDSVIEEFYVKKRKSIIDTHMEIRFQCHRADLSAPHLNTVRKRIRNRGLRRGLGKSVPTKTPLMGSYDEAQAPLAVVQIDHTQGDVMLVDEYDRKPLGRPWITLAIDCRTRCIPGFSVSLEAPSALSVGLCLSMAILPKDEWLAERDLDLEWPFWGFPARIHVDNGPDFKGKMLAKACEQHHIDLMFRPVRVPHYGGHIERLMGTTGNYIHNLSGTTGRNVIDREGRDPEKNAVMTIREFECWFAHALLGRYHNEKHSALGRPPIKELEDAYFRTEGSPLGLPPMPGNAHQLRLDFLPYEERTVQRYGILWDGITYYGDVIRRWVGSQENGRAQKFVVRRDPRDISSIYFFDPEAMTYYELPYADTTRPPINLWEYTGIKRRLAEEGNNQPDEDAIFRSYEAMRTMEQEATTRTRSQRKARSRRSFLHETPVRSAPATSVADSADDDDRQFVPFEADFGS